MNLGLIPTPVSICILDKNTLLEGQFYLTEGFSSYVPRSRDLFPENGSLPLEFKMDESLRKEAYILELTVWGATVKASGPNGAYYALTTLHQLLKLNGGKLCLMRIEDYPSMPLRGISDDISRGQISTMEDFKAMIRKMAYVKCNVYMPYMEDTFAFRQFPESGKYSDPVSQDEFRELIAYAKEYYITLIPIFNTIGHWNKNAKLAAFYDYVMKDEKGQPLSSLDVRKPQTEKMVEDMLSELIDVFGEAGAIHVGGDEVMDYTERFSKEEAGGYFNRHFNRVHDYLKTRGMETYMYSDMYTPLYGDYALGMDYIDEMPEDMNFVYWDYACRESYPNIQGLVEKKKKFCLSPATYTWNRMLPHHYMCWMNTRLLAQAGMENARGIIMSAWCDGGMSLREENWMGIYVGALYSWNCHNDLSFDQIISSYFSLFYGLTVDLDAYHALMSYDEKAVNWPYDPAEYEKGIAFWYDDWQKLGVQFFEEFWKDATEPADPEIQRKLAGAEQIFRQAYDYFSGLTPLENETGYAAFLFDIRRSLVAARKINMLSSRPYRSREEARLQIPAIDDMLHQLENLKEENCQRWFATNRQSEWEFVADKYDDLIESFRSLRRCCLHGLDLNGRKKL